VVETVEMERWEAKKLEEMKRRWMTTSLAYKYTQNASKSGTIVE
jgi:hypothetical protein